MNINPRLSAAVLSITLASSMAGDAYAQDSFKKDDRPPVDVTKEKVLYMVGYAHLDTQWRWTYPQVIREFLANTLHNNFALLDKYPNYVFNFSGSRRYEMMKEYYPADYEKLKGYVAAGRWFPCGSSVDEGDAIVPSLESIVRHILYGNHYFKREFGVTSHEFMLPDCFGFPASLPSILVHCGIDGFSTQKLTWGSAVGIPFPVGTWTGPDGTSVVAALDPGNYISTVTKDLSNSNWLTRINKTGEMSGAYVDFHYYGTGDRGGAPKEDSVKWIEQSLVGKGPIRVVSSKADAIFGDIKPQQKAKLPVYKGELLLVNHSDGTLTSQAYMKRWNRKGELLADAAERASVAASWLGGAPYPTKKLYDAWDLILGSQMHDMLPGTSLPKAYEYCWNDDLLALNQFAAVAGDAAGTVISALDTEAQGAPLVVYNPLSIEREDVVEADVKFTEAAPGAVRVLGPEGKPVPAQIKSVDGNKARILFLAHVPAVGFATYDVQAATVTGSLSDSSLKVSDTARTLENARYRVTLNAAGDVASIFDKINSREILASPMCLGFHDERPAKCPAWNMDWEDRQKPARAFVEGPAHVRVVEAGAVRVALEVERESQGSRFVQQVRLSAGAAEDVVEVVNKIDWRTYGVSLRASFPLTVSNPVATYDEKLGVVVRGNNDPKKFEVPQQEWFDLTDVEGKYGVAILNDSKFASDKPDDHTVRLTLLYTPGVRDYCQDQVSQDLGRHDIAYAIAGHAGDWKQGTVVWQGSRFNQPLIGFQAPSHPGKLGRSFRFFKVSTDQVEIVALKKAEDSDEIIVRLKERTGQPAHNLRLVAAGAIVSAREVNGQEQPVETQKPAINNGELMTDLSAYGLRAFALKLAPAPAPAAAPASQPVALAYDLDAFSFDTDRTDGGFDSDGRTYPAELIPSEIVSEGIPFKMGPTADGQKNAVVCRGQSIALPSGEFNRVYLLAAAVDGDAAGAFLIGKQKVDQTVQSWSSFIGQWDNRLWKGPVPELTYGWLNQLDGLVPGYTKRDTVAWYGSHRHHPQLGNEYYQYCYLFKYGFDVAPGTTSLTLPNNDKIRVFAVTVSTNSHDEVHATQPLYDTLEDHVPSAPKITPNSGKYSDTVPVTIESLYWKDGGLHYTLDGSDPTAFSPVYSGTVFLDTDATVRTRMIFPDGKSGPVASAKFEVHDVIPPVVNGVESAPLGTALWVEFSKPVDSKSAESLSNYRLNPMVPVQSAKLDLSGRFVKLTFAEPMATESRLRIAGVQSRSSKSNRLAETTFSVTPMKSLYSLDSMVCDGKDSKDEAVQGLPLKAEACWTMNLFVRMDQQPENHTVIAGFGKLADHTRQGRYFAKFANGVHFCGGGGNVETTTQFELGKWQMLTATFDGHFLTLYKDAQKIGTQELKFGDDESVIHIAPLDPWDNNLRFKGEIRRFTIWGGVLTEKGIHDLLESVRL